MYDPEPDMENDGYEVPNLIIEGDSSETLAEQNYSDSTNNNSMKRDKDSSDNNILNNNTGSQINISTVESGND